MSKTNTPAEQQANADLAIKVAAARAIHEAEAWAWQTVKCKYCEILTALQRGTARLIGGWAFPIRPDQPDNLQPYYCPHCNGKGTVQEFRSR